MVMAGDSNQLLSGPKGLCFNKDEFMEADFNVDQFVMECRRKVPLETLRDDLSMYLKILQSAMIELINKDYADFVNLSTNLVGVDKAINNLTTPLGQMQKEVENVKSAVETVSSAVEQKLNEQTQIREKKACLQRLMSIIHSVEKIEKLLGIQASDSHPTVNMYSGELNGQLIERVATEFNKLQFHVNKSRGSKLVEEIKPRIANITGTLQYSLEGLLREGMSSGDVQTLRQCLRTYATIDKMRDAENLFRQHVVKPYMEEVISEHFLNTHPQGLKGMYNKILEFIPKECKKLKEVTEASKESGGEVVRGYDFLVNAVWPEIVINIEARTPSIFAPGNPNVFHEKYLLSVWFVERFEKHCGSQASVKRLRVHPSYNNFMSKWSLPVYFQIRFQEIAGTLETAMFTPFNKSSESSSGFQLHVTDILWACLLKAWNPDILLLPLSHRFWKLSLQLVSRYVNWIEEVKQNEIKKAPGSTESDDSAGKTAATSVPRAPTPKGLSTGAKGAGNGEEGGGEGESTPPPPPPPTMAQIVCVIVDAQNMSNKLPEFYKNTVLPALGSLGIHNTAFLEESIGECQASLQGPLPDYGAYIVDELTAQCSVHLKMVNDIPRLFRRTNREIPSKPSGYVQSLLKCVHSFMREEGAIVPRDLRVQWATTIITSLSTQYLSITSDVLTSVKKMEESLKRLKRGKGSSSANLQAMGMSDDDKIRLQILLDVREFGQQVESLGVIKAEIESYTKLEELVNSTQIASSTT